MTIFRWMPRATVLALVVLAGSLASGAGSWTRVLDKDGIVVDQKDIPGRAMPAFRARTVIAAQPVEILAVLQDWRRHPEWRPQCVESKLIQQISPRSRFLYSRSGAPWPASDRDVVLYSEFEIENGGKRVSTRFRARKHDKAPPLEGVVRITHLQGHYLIESMGNGSSRVEYQVESDPGGNIPDWIVVRESRDMPLRTLQNLRRQVAKSRGHYADFIRRWAP